MTLAQKLKALRGKMSLRRLADELGVHYSYLSRLESGDLTSASEEFLDRLAAYFELPEEEQRALYLAAGKVPPEVLFLVQRDPERALAALRAAFADDLAAHVQEIARRLVAIGFSEAAADAYVCILRAGHLHEKELRDVPYEALQELILRRLVFYERQNSGRVYFVLDPATAFRTLWDEVLWQAAVSEEDLLKLPREEAAHLLAVRNTCRELAQMAGALYSFRRPLAAGQIRIAQDAEELALMLAETIARAEKEVVALSRSPRLPQVAPIWETLTDRMAAGVSYRRICDLDEIVEHGLHIKRRDMEEAGVQLRVLEAEVISRKFYLIDDRYGVIFWPGKAGNGFALAGQVVENAWLARKYRREFEVAWEEAIPGELVVDVLAEAAADLLEEAGRVLGPQGRAWLQKIVDWGIFARFPDMPEEERRRVEEAALTAGLVKRQADALIPRYGLTMADIRRRHVAQRVLVMALG
ncbi:MAG: XRE family transcriptional regulator [Caldilineae bacterium]|nr:MAG: XRE family transcriptional regulator [Caldilineae bacterium]